MLTFWLKYNMTQCITQWWPMCYASSVNLTMPKCRDILFRCRCAVCNLQVPPLYSRRCSHFGLNAKWPIACLKQQNGMICTQHEYKLSHIRVFTVHWKKTRETFHQIPWQTYCHWFLCNISSALKPKFYSIALIQRITTTTITGRNVYFYIEKYSLRLF